MSQEGSLAWWSGNSHKLSSMEDWMWKCEIGRRASYIFRVTTPPFGTWVWDTVAVSGGQGGIRSADWAWLWRSAERGGTGRNKRSLLGRASGQRNSAALDAGWWLCQKSFEGSCAPGHTWVLRRVVCRYPGRRPLTFKLMSWTSERSPWGTLGAGLVTSGIWLWVSRKEFWLWADVVWGVWRGLLLREPRAGLSRPLGWKGVVGKGRGNVTLFNFKASGRDRDRDGGK